MRKSFLNLKTLLVAAGLCAGSMSAWAAGYTRTLSDELTVAGYKAKAFYNFQNNTPEVLPTSGDLCYRGGNIWGLHNYGSGTRSATATIPVASSDILILQHYSSEIIATINRGTINATLSSSTGYQVYDITSTADDITFSIARYGGIVAAFVMEKDNSVATAGYTINYKSGGKTVYSYTPDTEIAIGSVVNAESTIWVESVKYLLDGGQTTSMTIAKGTNELNVNVTPASKYSYTINAMNSESVIEKLGEGSVYDGENTDYVAIQQYYNIDGILYQQNAIEYTKAAMTKNFAVDSDESVFSINYKATDIDVVYFSEGEDISGASRTNKGNIGARASKTYAGYSTEDDLTLTTLPAGSYKMYLSLTTPSAATTFAFIIGANEISATSFKTNFTFKTIFFTLAEETTIKLKANSGNENNGIDFLYIQNVSSLPATITSAGWATLYTPYALDFSGVAGLTAYTATLYGETVTLTAVNNVPANTGVVLKGNVGSYNIPVIASSSTPQGDLAGNASEATAYNAVKDKTLYVLTKDVDSDAQFNPVNEGSIAAGKAYLPVTTKTGTKLRVVIEGDATGIAALEAADAVESGVMYNLAGQQVTAAYKGIVIKNGKKFIIK